jgi:non-ribosomal peptide synthetase component F
MHMESPMLEAGEAIAQSRLHTEFLVSAARYPDRVALSIGQQQWTYAQIEELARRWAAQLIVVTGGQPARIGVLGYKSLTSYVGILASLFARRVCQQPRSDRANILRA